MSTMVGPLAKALQGAARVGILGIGSELRGDDNVGMLISSKLEGIFAKSPFIKVFLGGVAPENLSGEIKKFAPSHLLIIDCGNFGGRPGEARVVFPEEELFGTVFSTHKLPIKMLVSFLQSSMDIKAFMLLIQPKTIEFGAQMSPEVLAAGDSLVEEIAPVLNKP